MRFKIVAKYALFLLFIYLFCWLLANDFIRVRAGKEAIPTERYPALGWVYQNFRVYARAINDPSARMLLKTKIAYHPPSMVEDVAAMISPGISSAAQFGRLASEGMQIAKAKGM